MSVVSIVRKTIERTFDQLRIQTAFGVVERGGKNSVDFASNLQVGMGFANLRFGIDIVEMLYKLRVDSFDGRSHILGDVFCRVKMIQNVMPVHKFSDTHCAIPGVRPRDG